MDTITIKACAYTEAVLDIYKSVGWTIYASDPEKLRRAFENSLCILGAYDGDTLVGILRAVGDGETVVFLQDILVRPDKQGQGIGRKLMAEFFRKFADVRQIQLLTDDIPATVGFYRAVGMVPAEELHFKSFVKLRWK